MSVLKAVYVVGGAQPLARHRGEHAAKPHSPRNVLILLPSHAPFRLSDGAVCIQVDLREHVVHRPLYLPLHFINHTLGPLQRLARHLRRRPAHPTHLRRGESSGSDRYCSIGR